MNIDEMKSYKTEANLDRAVANTFPGLLPSGFSVRYMTVCNRDGRFVAIFPIGWNKDMNPGAIAHAGFLVVG